MFYTDIAAFKTYVWVLENIICYCLTKRLMIVGIRI